MLLCSKTYKSWRDLARASHSRHFLYLGPPTVKWLLPGAVIWNRSVERADRGGARALKWLTPWPEQWIEHKLFFRGCVSETLQRFSWFKVDLQGMTNNNENDGSHQSMCSSDRAMSAVWKRSNFSVCSTVLIIFLLNPECFFFYHHYSLLSVPEDFSLSWVAKTFIPT